MSNILYYNSHWKNDEFWLNGICHFVLDEIFGQCLIIYILFIVRCHLSPERSSLDKIKPFHWTVIDSRFLWISISCDFYRQSERWNEAKTSLSLHRIDLINSSLFIWSLNDARRSESFQVYALPELKAWNYGGFPCSVGNCVFRVVPIFCRIEYFCNLDFIRRKFSVTYFSFIRVNGLSNFHAFHPIPWR